MLARVDPDEAVAVVVILENGRVRTWGGIDTDDRRDWLDGCLDDARDLLTMLVPK